MSEDSPPSGGLGAHDVGPASLPFGPTGTPLGRPSLVRRLAVLLGVTAVVGVCGGASTKIYYERAQTMEARVSLRKIAKLAQASYARDGKLCPTLECLGFEGPGVTTSHFDYTYTATSESFIATAKGRGKTLTASGHITSRGELLVKKP